MMLWTRRQLLMAGTVGVAASALTGCRSIEQTLFPISAMSDGFVKHPQAARYSAARLLARVGFGHRPGDRTAVQTIGIDRYVDLQLNPEAIAESPAFLARLGPLEDRLPNDYGLLYEEDDRQLITSLTQATLLRAVYSNRSLFERMVEFWSDHFNVYAFKAVSLPQFTVMHNQNVLRKHALGSFRSLLGACARSAAILSFLDNDYNRSGRPNENYARELLELHTLGINGGYRQQDVATVARCLTGWTFDRKWRPGNFNFNVREHDTGSKTVLGSLLAATGQAEMEEVLDQLASHPSTARHLATKLLGRFRGDAAPEHVDHVAAVFLQSDGNISKTMRAVLLNCDATHGPPILKRPFDYIASALRVFDADTDGNAALAAHLRKMGQPLFEWPRPDGYTDSSKAWATCLSARWQFALDLSAGKIKNTNIDWSTQAPGNSANEVLARAFTSPQEFVGSKLRLSACLPGHTANEIAAMVLMSPQFQWR